jgi:hypothetical protein
MGHRRKLWGAAASALGSAAFWQRCARGIFVSVQQLLGQAEGALDRNQLLRTAERAEGMYQRRKERLGIPGREVRLQARRHGHLDRRLAEPDQPAHQGEHAAGDAVAR